MTTIARTEKKKRKKNTCGIYFNIFSRILNIWEPFLDNVRQYSEKVNLQIKIGGETISFNW